MPYECRVCREDPSSHSLKDLGTRDEVTLFYTCPANATKYNDTAGIINHYDGVLGENKKDWIWIFDGKGFGAKHMMEIGTGIALAKLITNKYGHNLKKIIIINPSWNIKTVLEIVTPFLSPRLRNLITMRKNESDLGMRNKTLQ